MSMDKLPKLMAEQYTHNQAEKNAKKQKEKLNGDIKQILKENGTQEFEAEGYKVNLDFQERDSMNQDKLIKVLKDLGFTDAIKTIEVPDESIVETLIYDGKIDAMSLSNCTETKIVEVLRVTKLKQPAKGGKK